MTDSVPPAKKVKLPDIPSAGARHNLSANPNCRRRIWLTAALIIAIGVTTYLSSFKGGFFDDDIGSVRDNPHIRKLWPLSEAMSIPLWSQYTSETVFGRPILSLSFAVNYALSGPKPWGYHLVNLIIHISAALLMFGIIRRTLHLERFHRRFGQRALPLAVAVALIWLVHPIQTESVTQIVQRAESLMGMFFLLTLYCVIRGFHSRRSRLWYLAAVVTCVLGMGTKEVMAAAPLIVPLYDYVFVSKSLKTMLRQRRIFYVSLAATWIILLALVIISHLTPTQSDTINESAMVLKSRSWLKYGLAQPGSVIQYLRLSIWPWPLDFLIIPAQQYSHSVFELIIHIAAVTGLLVLTFWGLLRRSWLGFVGAWFFFILAPSSSFIPTQNFMAGQRMYLSLAAVVTIILFGADYFLRKFLWPSIRLSHLKILNVGLVVTIVAVFGFITYQQNKTYESQLTRWFAVLRGHPDSIMVNNRIGNIYYKQNDLEQAKEYYEKALRIDPNTIKVHYNLGIVFASQGNLERAKAEFEYEIRINPNHIKAHHNLGNIFLAQGTPDKAAAEYERAIRIKPEQFADYTIDHHADAQINARINLGKVLLGQGKFDQAIANYEKALETAPDNIMAMNNLAWLLATCTKDNLRNGPKAVELAERLCSITDYQSPTYLNTLAAAYAEVGRFEEAVETATKALALTKLQNAPAAQIKQSQLYLEQYKAGRPFRYQPQ